MKSVFLRKLSEWYFKRESLPYWGVLLLDSFCVMISGYYCAYLKYGGADFAGKFWQITYGLLICLVFFIICFRLFHTYSGIIRFSSFVDLRRIASANIMATLGIILTSLLPEIKAIIFPDPVYSILIFVLATVMMWVARIFVKSLYDHFRYHSYTKKVFIYGAGPGAVATAKGLQNDEISQYTVVGFISPDGKNVGSSMMGSKVYKDSPELLRQMKTAGATHIIVSPSQVAHFRNQNALINDLTDAKIAIMMLPNPEEWDGTSPISQGRFKEVDIEDLLPRDQIQVDMDAIAAQLRDKCILITGAAGSIGSEIVRQVAAFSPERLILIDQAETPMHDIRLMMARQFPYVKAETIVASITNASFMERIFKKFKPEYVFHAAAYKHVPMMEDNPAIAIQNNVRGTRVIADLAVKYGTRKFVMISTDKAVNPTNVMGCSKRICEIYCQSLNKAIQEGKVEGNTQFVTTRFGNVLGSNGSVIPLFREQIKAGGPVTVTHPDIIRFFMLIPEACKLVLEAGTIGKGGEIFVFDMGQPVRIADLAQRMINLSGATDVQIKYTGLRDGEKLYEEVLSDKEKTKPTPNAKIFIANVREYDYADAVRNEDRLSELSETARPLEIVKLMAEIVPEYHTNNSAYLN